MRHLVERPEPSTARPRAWRHRAAAFCIFGLAACGAERFRAVDLLVHGMSRAEVALLFEAPLLHVSGPPRAETMVVIDKAKIVGPDPATERVFLKFRHDRLTGWKGDWSVRTRP